MKFLKKQGPVHSWATNVLTKMLVYLTDGNICQIPKVMFSTVGQDTVFVFENYPELEIGRSYSIEQMVCNDKKQVVGMATSKNEILVSEQLPTFCPQVPFTVQKSITSKKPILQIGNDIDDQRRKCEDNSSFMRTYDEGICRELSEIECKQRVFTKYMNGVCVRIDDDTIYDAIYEQKNNECKKLGDNYFYNNYSLKCMQFGDPNPNPRPIFDNIPVVEGAPCSDYLTVSNGLVCRVGVPDYDSPQWILNGLRWLRPRA